MYVMFNFHNYTSVLQEKKKKFEKESEKYHSQVDKNLNLSVKKKDSQLQEVRQVFISWAVKCRTEKSLLKCSFLFLNVVFFPPG